MQATMQATFNPAVSGLLYDLQIRSMPPKAVTPEECVSLFKETIQTEVVKQAQGQVDLKSSVPAEFHAFWDTLDAPLQGQLLTVLDKKGQEHLSDLIKSENPRTNISECFVEILKAEAAVLSTQVAAGAKHTLVKDSNALRAQLLPFALAKVLITSNGLFNAGIIGTVKDLFVLKGDPNLPLIESALQRFAALDECYTTLMSVKAPASEDNVSWALIKGAYGDVNDTKAKMCALATCLAPMPSEQNAMALQFGALLRETNLARFVELVGEVIQNGKLTRYVEGFNQEVAFSLSSTSSPLMAKIPVTVHGSIGDAWFSGVGLTKNDRLWTVPGIINACKAMGIENAQKATEDALQALLGEVPASKFAIKTARHDVTAHAVIAQMGGEKAFLGHAAFTATYEQPFIRGILSMLSDMATIRGRAYQLARVYQATQNELYGTTKTPETLAERTKMQSVFRDFLARFATSLKSTAASTEMAIKLVGDEEKLQSVTQYFQSTAFKDLSLAALVVDPSSFVRVYKGSDGHYFRPNSAVNLFEQLRKMATPNGMLSYITTDNMAFEVVRSDVFAKPLHEPIWDAFQKEGNAQMKLIVQNPEMQKDIYAWVKTLIGADSELFDETVAGFSKTPSVQEFRGNLHQVIDMMLADANEKAQAIEELDTHLMTLLSKAKPHLFAEFAKSVAPIEGEDVRLVFYPDPILSQTAVGMLVNGQVRRVDQDAWLKSAWEIGHTPKASE